MMTLLLIGDVKEASTRVVVQLLESHFSVHVARSKEDAHFIADESKPVMIVVDADFCLGTTDSLAFQLHLTHPHAYIVLLSDVRLPQPSDWRIGIVAVLPKSNESTVALACKLFEQYCSQRISLLGQLEQAQQAATHAMSSAGELGLLISLVKSAARVNDLSSLCEAFLASLWPAFNVDIVIQLYYEDKIITRTVTGNTSEAEEQRIAEFHRDERHIITKDKKIVFNYPGIVLEVQDMPSDDELLGRLRDNLAIACEIMSSSISRVENFDRAARQHQAAHESLKDTLSAIAEIDQKYSQQSLQISETLEQLRTRIDAELFHLGLTDTQEATLLKIIEETKSLANEIFRSGLEIDRKFEQVIKRLNAIEKPEVAAPIEDSDNSNAIELF